MEEEDSGNDTTPSMVEVNLEEFMLHPAMLAISQAADVNHGPADRINVPPVHDMTDSNVARLGV